MPSSPEELLCATFGEFGESALGSLSNQFTSHDEEHDPLYLLIGQIEARLRVFLEKVDPTPSTFAVALFRAASTTPEPSSETEQELRRVQGYIVGELNPLIQELRAKLTDVMTRQRWLEHDPHWQALTHAAGLYTRLAVGHPDSEPVWSFFGVMQALHGRDSSFPDIDYTEFGLPKEKSFAWIADIDPLDSDANHQYWLDFAAIEKQRGRPGTMPDLIRRRSYAAAYQLRDLASTYHVLADWIEARAEELRPDMKAHDVLAWRVGLHFASGSSEELIALLNAAEHLKNDQPQLFLEMMGFTPGPTYTQSAQPSVYFGGTFHLALLRSLQLELPEGDGWQEFKRRVHALLEFDIHLPPLTHISDSQMRMLEKNLVDTVHTTDFDDPESRTELTIRMVMFVTLLLPGYRMRKELDEMLRQLSVQEFDHRCRRLRVASPNEVARIVRAMPEALVGNTTFRTRVAERLADRERVDKMIVAMRDQRIDPSPQYAPQLWQTSPDVLLMSREFIDFLESVGHWIHSYVMEEQYAMSYSEPASEGARAADAMHGNLGDGDYDGHYPDPQEAARWAKRRRALVEDVIAVFNAHPDITEEQWIKWFPAILPIHRLFLSHLPEGFNPAEQPSAFFRCIPPPHPNPHPR